MPLDPDAFARFSHPRLHPDDRHQRGGRGICPRTGLQSGRAGARMFGPGNREDPRRPGRRAAAGGVCAWRPLRRLFRPMFDKRGAGRALRQSRRMRPGLPHALRFDLRRRARPARRPPLFVKPAGPGRAGSPAGLGPRRRGLAENRRPAQIPRICGQHHAGLPAALDKIRAEPAPPRPWPGESRYDLEMAFSRGLHTGWFGGVNNQRLVHARFGKKRGVYLGTVQRVEGRKFSPISKPRSRPATELYLTPAGPTKRRRAGGSIGWRRRGVRSRSLCVLGFGRGDVDFSRIHIGDRLWKTSDPELDRRLRQSFAGQAPHFRRPLSLEVHGRAAGPDDPDRAATNWGTSPKCNQPCRWPSRQTQPLTTEKLGNNSAALAERFSNWTACRTGSKAGSFCPPAS